jgi:hypothetical protein
LAIEAEREEDRYESTITVKHLDFEGIEVDKSIGNVSKGFSALQFYFFILFVLTCAYLASTSD